MRESAYSRIKSSTNFAITRSISWANANWKWVTFLIWIGVCAYYLSVRQDNIFWFTLNDTDDNIRYVQVQDWLNGQGWYDLRQYRLDPPGGANIHWSRIVDIPIAGLILFFRLFMENGQADRWACAIAPMLPLFVLMLGLGFITRRLSAAGSPAWIIAAIAPLGAPMGISMYMPLRIDHHGWQLAFMVLTLAGILDRKWMRGGVVAGLSTALSIAIGMEMMVYLAGAGGLIALRWVFKDGAGRRMAPYALSLGGGMGVMFALFASDANRLPMCDSISPIWVAVMGLVSAGMLILSMLPLRNWPMRLMAGAVVGGIIGGFALSIWPQCFTGAYQISPELDRLWLSHVREAKPITAQSLPSAISMLALPIGGAMAAIIACITVRRDTERLWAWATVTLMTLFALGLMFWQVRAGPAAQLLAIPAIAWAAYAVLERIIAGSWRVRIAAAFGGALLLALFNASFVYRYVNRWTNAITGGPPPMNASQQSAQKARTERLERIRRANARCRTLPALQALNALPPATIFTLVDLSPRLIATTHHSAIAGPYHRNEKAILDIHHAFDGNADNFRAIARRHGARYFLICPDFPEGTVYRSRSPNGFYAHAERGDVPPWMHQILLKNGDKLPYRLYRIED